MKQHDQNQQGGDSSRENRFHARRHGGSIAPLGGQIVLEHSAPPGKNRSMSIDEIRRQKADTLLEFQESESRVMQAAGTARLLACSIEEFAKLLRPEDVLGKSGAVAVKGPNVTALRNAQFRAALDYEKAIGVAEQLRDATVQLAEAQAKKNELGLR